MGGRPDWPQAWIMREKSLATWGVICRARVITGKATAPPPSLVIPTTPWCNAPWQQKTWCNIPWQHSIWCHGPWLQNIWCHYPWQHKIWWYSMTTHYMIPFSKTTKHMMSCSMTTQNKMLCSRSTCYGWPEDHGQGQEVPTREVFKVVVPNCLENRLCCQWNQ